jgi:hypothetical protein
LPWEAGFWHPPLKHKESLGGGSCKPPSVAIRVAVARSLVDITSRIFSDARSETWKEAIWFQPDTLTEALANDAIINVPFFYALNHRNYLYRRVGRPRFRNYQLVEPLRARPGADSASSEIMKREPETVEAERPQSARLNLAENEMHHLVEDLQVGLVHASDRPDIEAHILMFLDHANGPTTAGIASEMGISPEAASVHLAELEDANRIWSQPSHGAEVTWHIALEGQHFIAQRGLR